MALWTYAVCIALYNWSAFYSLFFDLISIPAETVNGVLAVFASQRVPSGHKRFSNTIKFRLGLSRPADISSPEDAAGRRLLRWRTLMQDTGNEFLIEIMTIVACHILYAKIETTVNWPSKLHDASRTNAACKIILMQGMKTSVTTALRDWRRKHTHV